MVDGEYTLSGEPVLYVVATPIGNLADMVPRAIEVLQTCDLIAAEDTRHSKRLMQHFNIETPMIAYHDHSGSSAVDALLAKMTSGQSLASTGHRPALSSPCSVRMSIRT